MKPKDPSSNPSEQDRNEARVLAMLLGESDPEEQTALDELLAEDADLRAYRDRTANRLGLMGEAAQGKAALEADPLQLDPERRAELQALLANEEKSSQSEEEPVVPFKPEDEKTRYGFLYLAAAAAVAFAIVMNWPNQADENVTVVASGQGTASGNDSQKKVAADEERSGIDSEKKRFSVSKTKAVSEISAPESVSSDKTNGISPVESFDAEVLDGALNRAVSQTTNEILDQRVAGDIAVINQDGKDMNLFRKPESRVLIVNEMPTDGFAFAKTGGGDDPGGFAAQEELESDRLRARTASVGQAKPMPVPASLNSTSPSPFLPPPADSPTEPAPEADLAVLGTVKAPKPSIQGVLNDKDQVRADFSLKGDKELAKSESEEKSSEDSLALGSRRDRLEGNDEPSSSSGAGSAKISIEKEGEKLADEAGLSNRLRRKNSEKLKETTRTTASDASASTGETEENPSLEGFVDSSYTKEEEERGEEQSKLGQASTHLHTDLGTAPPPQPIQPNPERVVAEQPLSSFNLKSNDVSFGLAHASIQKGLWPAPATIRSEEFLNAFDSGDPIAVKDEVLSFRMERTHHPFVNNRQVLRFSVSAAPAENQKPKPLNLVIALDISSSMKTGDRLEMAQKTLHGLAQSLTPDDRFSLVIFAAQPKVLFKQLPGDQLKNSISEIAQLGSEEETNLGLGLDRSYAIALEGLLPKGNNRVLVLSDGGVNFGEKDPQVLKAKGDAHGRLGITIDCIGLGAEGYQDHVLEAISRKGRYFFINGLEDVDNALVGKINNSLRPAFTNLKAQIEFDPGRVEIYRQVGFERVQLRKQYFDENSVGGSEIALGESSDALYVVKVNPKGKGNLGVLRVAFKDLRTGKTEQREWPLPYEPEIPAFVDASNSMRLAVHAATFAEWLADSPYSSGFRIEQAIEDLPSIRKGFPDKASIDRLSEMMIRSRSISR